MNYFEPPTKFLNIRISDTHLNPSLTAACVDYESGVWREKQFAEHLVEWLPEFCLKYTEVKGLGAHNALRLLRKAASSVYTTKKFENRGEIGEIILHAIIRHEFNTVPLISKIYYKDSSNDTVKGFDCVHVVESNDSFELWLGEAKFYSNFNDAARDVVKEIKLHIESDYLRSEFMAICNKTDDNHPVTQKVIELLDKSTSLDIIFKKIVIPVLITYESSAVSNHNSITESFESALKLEVENNYKHFVQKIGNINIIIHLIMVPLYQKNLLIKAFDEELGRLR